MRRAAAAVMVLSLLAALAVPASGDSQAGGVLLFEFGSVGRFSLVRTTDLPARVTGRLTVEFHGDRASGCQERGLCDVSGTAVWEPPGSVDIVLAEVARGHRHIVQPLIFGGGDSVFGLGASVRASVTRGAGAACADGHSDLGQSFDATARGRALAIQLTRHADLIATRCEGPIAGDVRGVLRTARIRAAVLERGHRTIDLSASGAFAGHGLAGRVSSTIRLRAGAPRHRGITVAPSFARTRRPHFRSITLRYRVERVTGNIPVAFTATADPDVCAPLDACGVTGTDVLTPESTGGTALLSASAPLRRPRRDLLAALGLSRRGNPRGIPVYGELDWHRTAASTAVSSVRRNGTTACSDTVPLLPHDVGLGRRGERLTATYPLPGDLQETDPLLNRCPGPELGDIVGQAPLAQGSIPLRALRGRRVAIHLAAGAAHSGLAYSGRSSPDMSIVLDRDHVYEQRFRR